MSNCKEEISSLQTGERYIIPDSRLEVWRIHDDYFLFELMGDRVTFAGYYEDIDRLIVDTSK